MAHTVPWGIVLFLLAQVTAASGQAVSEPPQPTEIAGAVSRVYKTVGETQLRLHLFDSGRPEATARRPAIVFFFGGGWMNGRVEQFVPQAKHLAARGMVAVVADYRVRNRHGTTPFDAMADAKSAIRWLRSHSKELGIDPNRIVAAGGSAGGHLALSAAVFDQFDEPTENKSISSTPDALVLFNPVVDATTTDRNARMGGRGKDGSPLYHLSATNLPPTLILHGKSDTTVPYSDVQRFCAEAVRLQLSCKLVGYEGGTHGFFNPNVEDGKWYTPTLAEADRFVVQLGYLRPLP